jgi:hypothetical protein
LSRLLHSLPGPPSAIRTSECHFFPSNLFHSDRTFWWWYV